MQWIYYRCCDGIYRNALREELERDQIDTGHQGEVGAAWDRVRKVVEWHGTTPVIVFPNGDVEREWHSIPVWALKIPKDLTVEQVNH